MQFLVISHGPFCEALVESTKMIYGPIEDIKALPLLEGSDPDAYLENLEAEISSAGSDVFVFVDFVGGTPFNSLMRLSAKYTSIHAFAGVNMPLLMEALSLREYSSCDGILEGLKEMAPQSIVDLAPHMDRIRTASD